MRLVPAQTPPTDPPKLRLVGDGSAPERASAAVRREVAKENHSARHLSVEDMREVFSARVVSALDGGTAAILRPQVRRDLVAAAVGLGFSPFEANLVIAIVQDSARRGAVGRSAVARAKLVELRRVERAAGGVVWWVVLTCVLTVVLLAALIGLTLLL